MIVKTEEPLSATVEEYLETIYNMSMEDEVVIGARLAEKFDVAPPTVTEMLKRVKDQGIQKGGLVSVAEFKDIVESVLVAR